MECLKTKGRYVFLVVPVLAFVLFLGPGIGTAKAVPDISGHWFGNNGREYNIIQFGDKFEWQVLGSSEIGVGEIKGNNASAAWPFGFATGNIITEPSGWAVEIFWSNGVVFMRSGGGAPPPGGGGTPGGGGNDLNFSFGPNPATAGGELWIDLTRNEANHVNVFLNNVHLPIVDKKGASYIVVKLPSNIGSGFPEIEFQGRRIRSNQPHNWLDVMPAGSTPPPSPPPPGGGPVPGFHFDFNPKSAKKGQEIEIWINEPVAQNSTIFYAGKPLPKKTLDNHHIRVNIPTDAKSDYFEVEYNGHRYQNPTKLNVTN
jgi:hypothetical protein